VIGERVPFLWLCGPSGVGKSSVGYEIFRQVYQSGIKAGYLDFDQVGICYPGPADDPANHRVKAQNLGAVWPTYRAAGARCLIAAGGVETLETVRQYAEMAPDTDLTLCRLRAGDDKLTERIFRRGLGRGPVAPGPLASRPAQQLAALAAEAAREATELDAADFADLCVDTGHRSVQRVARLIRDLAGGWPQVPADPACSHAGVLAGSCTGG
jgi:hypothetical protein